jgi:hypothetical protein
MRKMVIVNNVVPVWTQNLSPRAETAYWITEWQSSNIELLGSAHDRKGYHSESFCLLIYSHTSATVQMACLPLTVVVKFVH